VDSKSSTMQMATWSTVKCQPGETLLDRCQFGALNCPKYFPWMRLRCHFQWHKISPVTKVSTQSTCQMNLNWLKYISLKYTGNLLLAFSFFVVHGKSSAPLLSALYLHFAGAPVICKGTTCPLLALFGTCSLTFPTITLIYCGNGYTRASPALGEGVDPLDRSSVSHHFAQWILLLANQEQDVKGSVASSTSAGDSYQTGSPLSAFRCPLAISTRSVTHHWVSQSLFTHAGWSTCLKSA
jgi:hypothetical protein